MSSIALASPKEELKRLVKHCAEYRALAESAVCHGDATPYNVHNPHLT
jgi:Ser/Thr protein kinase RdoA (MazF antagonist)